LILKRVTPVCKVFQACPDFLVLKVLREIKARQAKTVATAQR
jgi:hypothetical protein